jgi:hypothetical protein
MRPASWGFILLVFCSSHSDPLSLLHIIMPRFWDSHRKMLPKISLTSTATSSSDVFPWIGHAARLALFKPNQQVQSSPAPHAPLLVWYVPLFALYHTISFATLGSFGVSSGWL